MVIHTPDHRLRVFVSSTLKELAEERAAVRRAITKLRLNPVMFESGARPHPPQELYRSYLAQSQIFIGIYWQSYGWIGPGMQVSGLEDEYNLSSRLPSLIYIKNPAPDRDPVLGALLTRIRNEDRGSYAYFSLPQELQELVENDLAVLLTERFENGHQPSQGGSWAAPRSNVPVPRSPLVGREHELAAARDLLLRDDVAMLTLTGAGGSGKSRLAIQICLSLLDRFPDGVFVVELEPITDPNLVISAIAETLGIREAPQGRSVAEMLVEILRERRVMLLLDNFEHVLAAAPQVSHLLEACPRLKLLVTSRSPLRVRAERELAIQPLPVPPLQAAPDAQSLAQNESIQLFVQRAQALRPDFELTDANASVVAEICRLLDGLPLAIELAAARIKMLAPSELRARLDQGLDVLRGGTRDLPERQQTLRATIDWSYNLVDDDAKMLFRRLSVFAGGSTLEAVGHVCSLDGELEQIVEDALAALVDSSLVIQLPQAAGPTRFGMLSTIRGYAAERLTESGEADSVHLRHARHYVDFVNTVEPLIRTSERAHWQLVFQEEFANIRAALEWTSADDASARIGAQLAAGLGFSWLTAGHMVEGRKWIARFLDGREHSPTGVERAALLSCAGLLAWAGGDFVSALAQVDESLGLLAAADSDAPAIGKLLAATLMLRALLATAARDAETAEAMFGRSIQLFRAMGDPWYEAVATSWLGDLARYENDNERALALHADSIRLARQQGDPWCLIPSLMSTGQIAIVDGDLQGARTNLEEAETLLRQAGDPWTLAWALNDLGFIALRQRRFQQAADRYREALDLASKSGNTRVLLIAMVGAAALIGSRSARVPLAEGQDAAGLALAARLCGSTAVHVEQPGVFIWPDSRHLYEGAVADVKSLMDDDLWNRAYSEGHGMNLDQAVAIAVGELGDSDRLHEPTSPKIA